MKRLTLVVVALFALALPAASAQAQGGGEKKNPAKHCKALGKKMGAKGFEGKKAERRLAHCQKKLRKAKLRQARRACRAEGKRGHQLKRCVAAKLATDAAPTTEALKNAALECKTLRDEDPEEFTAEYGDGSNAFGKCVVDHVQDKADADEPETADDDPGSDDEADDTVAEPDDPGTT